MDKYILVSQVGGVYVKDFALSAGIAIGTTLKGEAYVFDSRKQAERVADRFKCSVRKEAV